MLTPFEISRNSHVEYESEVVVAESVPSIT